MLTIKRGRTKLRVTRGAYEAFYKATWKIVATDDGVEAAAPVAPKATQVADKAPEAKQDDPSVQQDEAGTDGTEDEDEDYGPDTTSTGLTDEEVLEVPVAEMNLDQLKQAATALDIDWKAQGITKTKKLREAVKAGLAGRE